MRQYFFYVEEDRDNLSSKNNVYETDSLRQSGLEKFVVKEKSTTEEKLLSMVEKLTKKVDNLANATTENSKKKAGPLPSLQFSEEMKDSYSQMNEWKKVRNIVELVSRVKDLELFPMSEDDDHDIFDSGGAILRCKTCFSLYKDKALKLTPARAAKKLAADCKSICTGRYLNPEKMSSLISGEGAY